MGVRTTRDWFVRLSRREPAGSVLVYGALVVNVVCTAVVLFLTESLTPRERAWLLLGALSAWVLLVVVGWARGSLPRAGVIIAICITIFAAVSTPSNQSRDVYSYAMYGRIVTEYHANPFSSYPVHFEGDPIRPHVGTMWQRTPDIYGPAFTAIMAGLAPINGASTFRVRFSYQLVSAAAIALGIYVSVTWDRVWDAPLPEIHRSSDPAVIRRGEYLVYGPAHCSECLSFEIAMGSSTQIAMLITPLLIFISFIMGTPMTMMFNYYEIAVLALAVLIAKFVSLDGESNWMEGAMLMAAYFIIAVAFYLL
jgi:hypothetical protein